MTTIVDGLERHAHERPDAPAYVEEGRTVRYHELHALASGCADWLATEGVEPNDVVGITIPDALTHYVVALGLASLGAAHVTLPSHDPVPVRARLADRTGARRVVDDVPAALLDAWAARPSPSLCTPDPSSPLTWFTTTGTTGEQKLIPVRHVDIVRQAERAVVGCAMPLSSVEYSYAKRQFLYAVLAGTTIAVRGASMTPLSLLCVALGVDVVPCMNAQAQALVAECTRHGRLPPYTRLRISGARASIPFRRELLDRVCDGVEVTYSMQECGSVAHAIERSAASVSESVGWPHPGVDVEIVDERGRPLPRGELGEIRIRAPGMASAYLDDDAATARHFRDGWLHPGDRGILMPDGALVVHGRADDVMNLNGIKIAPAEIERVLEQHAAVKAVVAFPLRSAVHGEVPIAAVELHAGAVVDEKTLQRFARERLGLAAPRRVMIVASLPATPLGKIDVARLAALAEER